MNERQYQKELKQRIANRFPGCVIQENDPRKTQGICDLTIFHKDKWAMLEVKMSADAPTQPNQPYYVEKMNKLSFAAFIYPDNERQVLDDLQHAFDNRRKTRVSQS